MKMTMDRYVRDTQCDVLYDFPSNRFLTEKDLIISEIGLGAYPFTEHWRKDSDSDDPVALINYALDNGINLIDTSEMHGDGRTEELVGKAIKHRRDEVAIVTKGGFMQAPGGKHGDWQIDASAANIRRAIDDSLRRLGTDYIDYYLTHFPDPKTPLEETMDVLQEAKEAGKVLSTGYSNYAAADIKAAATMGPLPTRRYHSTVSATQHHYSLLDRSLEETVIPLVRDNYCMGYPLVMAYRVLERGLLTGRLTRDSVPHDPARSNYSMFREPELSANLAKVEVLKDVASDCGRTPAQVAIRWVLSTPEVSTALVGARTRDQLTEHIGALGWQLGQADTDRLNKTFAA